MIHSLWEILNTAFIFNFHNCQRDSHTHMNLQVKCDIFAWMNHKEISVVFMNPGAMYRRGKPTDHQVPFLVDTGPYVIKAIIITHHAHGMWKFRKEEQKKQKEHLS